jgi:photosystem II stability/assembly factor-like uncharacterized protein
MRSSRRLLPIIALSLTALARVTAAQENAWTSHGPTGVGWVNDVTVGDSVAYAATLNGVFRSDDAGARWQQSGLAGDSIAQVLAPVGSAVVLARTTSGTLYLSRDGRDFWARVPGLGTVTLAAVDPGHPLTAYAGTGDGTIWKSKDAGSSWQRLSVLPRGFGPWALAVDSAAIYAIAANDVENAYKLYKSLDGGVSWATVSSPIISHTTVATGAAAGFVYTGGLNTFCRSADSTATWTCSNFPDWPTRIVEVSGGGPDTAPRILAVSPGGVYVSGDGGATWARGDGELGSVGYVAALASDASGTLVLAGTDIGIFRSQDRGDSWTPASVGLRSSITNVLALDPQDPSTVWAGSPGSNGRNSSLFRSADAGLSWTLGNGPENALSALVIDPEHPSTLYAGGSSVSRSDDGGAHWTSSPAPSSTHVYALALDPDSPERVWAATYGGLFRSDDGAHSFESAPAVPQEIYCILFDAEKTGTMYAGSYYDVEPGYYGYPYGGSIFFSYDSGASWTKSAHDVGSPVYTIATDPFQNGVLYAGTTTGVLRSADGGVTWQGPGVGLPQNSGIPTSLVADPVRPGRLYIVIDGRVYRTTDGAQTWQPFSSGLGSLQAQPLVISPDGKRLHAGTNGGGVFELDLGSSQTCSPTETRLCLVDNRYAVELLAARAGEVPNTPGVAQPLSDRSGFFALPFATGDPALPEVVVKMLPEGTFGAAGAPFFYASLTTLPFALTVTDKVTGQVQVYGSQSDGQLCGGTDLVPDTSPNPWDYSARPLSARAAAGETALELLGGRFSVTLEARRPGSGRIASGVAMASGDRFGFFSLPDFTGDPQFPEVVVKMVDARSFGGHFWFFHSSMTSLDYTLTVTDSVTGVTRTYASTTPFCGTADTRAFADSP